MKIINNPVIPFIIIGMFILTADSLCKNQIRDTLSGPHRDTSFEKPAIQAQSEDKGDSGVKRSAPLPFSEKEIQPFESIENEGKYIEFGIGIIL
jgi:hypothetical protein